MQNSSATLKHRALNEFSKSHIKQGRLDIRKMNMTSDHINKIVKVQKLSLGPEDTSKPTKVILLVGATGSGKTTLINSMVNVIFGVKIDDPFRFILLDDINAKKKSETESQTEFMTAYVFNYINGMPFGCSYVLIDTPGFGDTQGIRKDRDMMGQLEMLLKQGYGIDAINCVGFVTQSQNVRLTQTKQYIINGLLQMFGNNITENMFVMATHADHKRPPVLDAMKIAKLEYSASYKFNNSVFFEDIKGPKTNDNECDPDDDPNYKDMDLMYWDIGYNNIIKFFLKVNTTSPVSLSLTKEVLNERQRLQHAVLNLQTLISFGLSKLSDLQQERDMLTEGYKDCEKEMYETKSIKVPLGPNEYNLYCNNCHWTCKTHNSYSCSQYEGRCDICPNKCILENHQKNNFRLEIVREKSMKKKLDHLKQYNNVEQEVKLKEDGISKLSGEILREINWAHVHVKRLDEIALKPNSLTTNGYINIMIESQIQQNRPYSQWEIKLLKKLQTEEELLQKVVETPNQVCGIELLEQFREIVLKDREDRDTAIE